MIRQAISCDICGRDKQQTNHWFVAYEHGLELRISGWNSQARTSTKAKHLCGQTCMHKLVDDFMARAIASRTDAATGETPVADQSRTEASGMRIDASLTTASAHPLRVHIPCPATANVDDPGSSACLLPSASAGEPFKKVVCSPDRPEYGSRAWRAEAWRREQERERRNGNNAKMPRRGSAA